MSKPLFHFLSIAAALFVGLAIGQAQTTNAPLTFYVVSAQKIDGWRFIDTTNFPKLGYIAVKPDLIITNLAKVYHTKQPDQSVVFDANGRPTVAPKQPSPSISIQFAPDDAKQFEALTERAIDKKLLIMLGERPLIAPVVQEPIAVPYVSISSPSAIELNSIESELKKLVRSDRD